MTIRLTKFAIAAASTLTLAGCADGSTGMLATSSLNTASAATPAAKADPVCVSLNQRINALRQEGVATNVEKAAAGKAKTVSVKRESLVKMAELDKANAEFQAKCSVPLPASAAVVPPAAPAANTAAAKPAASATAAKTASAAPTAATATAPKPQ